MTDKIEPGCLAETLTFKGNSFKPPAIVNVLHRVPASEVCRLKDVATGLAALNLSKATHLFGIECFWRIAFDDGRYPPTIFPDPMLRRLPPPDLNQLTANKNASVPA